METTILTLTLAVFAVYRMSLMITCEDGPFDIFYSIREINKNEYGTANWFVRGLHCPLCVSFWLSFVAGLAFWDGLGLYLVYSLGIAGTVTFMIMLAGIPGDD